jgi:ferredoxin-NADP reductase
MLRGSLRGEAPPYLVPRRGRRSWTTPPRRSVIAWESFAVVEVIHETPDAVTLVLARPDGRDLEFVAGQFLTVEVEVDGEPLRRAYSLSSAPSDRRLSITVKRVAGGRVSNHLNDHARAGTILKVRGPSGSFAAPDDARALVLLAGGSGITPLLSIAREALARDPWTRVTLIYGNRGIDDVIFADALARMAERDERFTIDSVLSDPPESWHGARGILDRPMVEARLDALDVDTEAASFLLCGPEPMRQACRAALRGRGVPPQRIREEIFVRPELRDEGAPMPTKKLTVRVHAGGETRDVVVAPGRTLLEAGLSAGAALPFSCTMGGCAACKVKLTAGEVRMEEPNCLTPAEREAGYVLTCVTRPLGPCTVEVDA